MSFSWIEEKQLLENRAKLVEQAGQLIKTAHSENRDLTGDENEKFERLHGDADKIMEQVQQYRRQRDAENNEYVGREDVRADNSEDKKKKVFNKFLRFGREGLEPEERFALSTTGTNAGAELVPESFHNQLYVKLQDLTSVLEAGPTVLNTTNGETYPMPIIDDTSNTGERLSGQNVQVDVDGTSDPSTSALNLGSYIYSSRVVKLPLALVEDAAFDIEARLIDMLSQRIAKVTNVDFTTGTGDSQPQGCVTGATQGKVGASQTSVSYTEILDTIHSLPRYHRQGAKFMFNDATLLSIRKLVDGDGNLLWHHSTPAAGMADTIGGYEYVINTNMADLGQAAKPILFANWTNAYVVRFVNQIQTYVFVEKYLDYLQRGYLCTIRADAGVYDSSAIKYFQNANS